MITAALIVAAVGGMGFAVAQPASAAVPRHVLSAGDGSANYAKYRPHTIDFTQDGTLWMTGTHWSRWTARRAVGHGIAHVNNCDPYCAGGSIANVPARIVESHPVTVCGQRVFSRYELDYRWRPFGHEPRRWVRTYARTYSITPPYRIAFNC